MLNEHAFLHVCIQQRICKVADFLLLSFDRHTRRAHDLRSQLLSLDGQGFADGHPAGLGDCPLTYGNLMKQLSSQMLMEAQAGPQATALGPLWE